MSRAIAGVRELLFPRALVNAFVVEADVLTLVDTGTPGGAGRMLAAVREAGHDPRDVGRILVTHRHSDHAGDAAELARVTGRGPRFPDDSIFFLLEGSRAAPAACRDAARARTGPVGQDRPALDAGPGGRRAGARGRGNPRSVPGHRDAGAHRRPRLDPLSDLGVLFTADAAANITRIGPHPAADGPSQAREKLPPPSSAGVSTPPASVTGARSPPARRPPSRGCLSEVSAVPGRVRANEQRRAGR